MIASANAEDHPPLGQDIGHRVVLGESQRVPHGRNVEAAADLNPLGHMGEVHSIQQEIGDALIAFRLEMVFCHPEAIIAQPIQRFGDGFGFRKDGDEILVREPTVVDGRAAIPDVVHINVSGKAAVKMGDHSIPPYPDIQTGWPTPL